MEALWATILFSGFALEVIIRHEKNSVEAITKAIANGYGVETDIRDRSSELVISHDMPLDSAPRLRELSKIFSSSKYPIALNIKADGLSKKLLNFISLNSIENYFAFDMSIPEMYQYNKLGINFFSHVSDICRTPILTDSERCKGLWVDSFSENIWYDIDEINKLISKYNKNLCFVSEDLHNRDNKTQWKLIKQVNHNLEKEIILCTDHPEDAKEFFYD